MSAKNSGNVWAVGAHSAPSDPLVGGEGVAAP